jgi:hypothetical protein
MLLLVAFFTHFLVSSLSSAAAGPVVVGNATRWRELQSNNSWNDLLDPLDMDLRRSIISHGELVQATYDDFNRERWHQLGHRCRNLTLAATRPKVATRQKTQLAMGGGMVPISEWREMAMARCRGGKWETKKRWRCLG